MTDGQKACIVGAGTMGKGIALVFARAGWLVSIFDTAPGACDDALRGVRSDLGRAVERGKLSDMERDATVERLTAHASLRDACRGAHVIVESIVERMDTKADVLREVAEAAPVDALLASNTSALSLTELGARVGVPDRVVGMHFFNPAPVMELVEVVRGYLSSESVVARAVAIARSVGKTPIVVNDSPGFATSRLGVLLGAEAIRMLESGVASAADIDRGMELGYRHPMGPLKLTDVVGLDVRLAVLEHLHRELGEAFRPPTLLRTLVRAGRLGKKSGAGFYDWTADGPVAQ